MIEEVYINFLKKNYPFPWKIELPWNQTCSSSVRHHPQTRPSSPSRPQFGGCRDRLPPRNLPRIATHRDRNSGVTFTASKTEQNRTKRAVWSSIEHQNDHLDLEIFGTSRTADKTVNIAERKFEISIGARALQIYFLLRFSKVWLRMLIHLLKTLPIRQWRHVAEGFIVLFPG